MNKRIVRWLLVGGCCYALLLAALVFAEYRAPGATIRGLGDALWFSLVTLTTVGFGDLTPVTLPGKLIAAVFLLLSVGLLASLLGLTWSFFRGTLLPRLRLSVLRRSPCTVFPQPNAAAAAFGADLLRRDPKARVLFCRADPSSLSLPSRRAVCLPLAAEDALRLLSGAPSRTVCLTGEDEGENRALAERLRPLCPRIVCRGKEQVRAEGVRFYDDVDGVARAYWLAHTLRPGEKSILLIGDGALAERLLIQAVLINCRVPFGAADYHLFGCWESFQRLHPVLCQNLSSAASGGPRDRLIFHPGSWDQDFSLLTGADRIMFCAGDSRINASRAEDLFRWVPASASVYVRADSPVSPGIPFGALEEVWTAELVFRSALDRQAQLLHGLYSRGQEEPERWELLSPFLKNSNRASADHLLTKLRLLLPDADPRTVTPALCREAFARWQADPDRDAWRRNEHERWCRYSRVYNWRPGAEKEPARRTHPSLIPYEDLSPEEQAKDDNAWLLLGQLAKEDLT